jgi:hypothetical protein
MFEAFDEASEGMDFIPLDLCDKALDSTIHINRTETNQILFLE